MAATEPRAPAFELIGGRLCLDFVNTVAWGDGVYINERLNSYGDLVAWARVAGVLSEKEAHGLLRQAARRRKDALAVLEEAVSFRRGIRPLLSHAVRRRAPDPADLEVLNLVLSRGLAHPGVAATPAGFDWQWTGGGHDLAQMLWPVAWSAATLLTSDELRLVRECAGDACGWVFLDLSRNRTRRWCDMKGCGNRAKARRHYHRRKQRTGEEWPALPSGHLAKSG